MESAETYNAGVSVNARRQQWLRWPVLAGVWMLVGLYFAVQTYLQRYYEHQPITLGEALGKGLIFWGIWAALSPSILWLARTFRFSRKDWLDALVLHLPAGVIYSFLHLCLYVLATERLYPSWPALSIDRAITQFQVIYSSSFSWWSTIYWTILIASYAFEYSRRYREGELHASRLKGELAEAQLQATQAQLQALRMQVQPHFLFNTLNSISELLHEDADAADEMIARLGDFFRMTLDAPAEHEVTLETELEFLHCYLDIERIRFEDRLATRLDVAPETLSARVPHLILQPIVENAIKHGIAPRAAAGRIEIKASRQGEMLRLEVRDNGLGIAPCGSLDDARKHGVGFANTRARLEQRFGNCYRFEARTAPGGGTLVSVEIPFENSAIETAGELVRA